jgi:hypothetical protein
LKVCIVMESSTPLSPTIHNMVKGVFKLNSWGAWHKLKPRTKNIMKQAT